jgi:UDP-N-acetyl-D-mannosaminuronic acid dehydrogenase
MPKNNKVCVVGLGYVGIPTACAIANAGFKTIGVDIKSDVVKKINIGESPLSEQEIENSIKELVESRMLSATEDIETAVTSSDVIFICVQTPLLDGKSDLRYLKNATKSVAKYLQKDSLVILECSVPPKTCEYEILPIFDSVGFRDGYDFYFAYLPERLSPGASLSEFTLNDRVVGVDNEKSRDISLKFMKSIIKGEIHITTIRTAETAKLVENTSRDVYIAFANELSKICTIIGVDVDKVIALSNTHPRVKILNPGPGVGGPCLTKDSLFLIDKIKNEDVGIIIRQARLLNNNMYKDVISLIKKGLGKRISSSKVAVFGTSYKAEVDDTRNSPSEDVIRVLIEEGVDVVAYDPYTKESFGAKKAESFEEAIRNADCAVFLVAHDSFRKRLENRDFIELMNSNPVIVDTVRVFSIQNPSVQDKKWGEYKFLKLGGVY